MKNISQQEFMVETMGGWPVKANVSAYTGKNFDCACGKVHQFSGGNSEVLRELSGMRFVFRCPDRNGLTLVKIKGLFSVKIESVVGSKD